MDFGGGAGSLDEVGGAGVAGAGAVVGLPEYTLISGCFSGDLPGAAE